MTRLTNQELAALRSFVVRARAKNLDNAILPADKAERLIDELSQAYAEIDRVAGVATELQRDMTGTLATLEAERRRNAG